MPARRTSAGRPLSREAVGVSSLTRDAFHELANRLSIVRLTAHVEGRAARGPAGAPLREIEALTAPCGALLTATRALVGRRDGTTVRVSPATILEGLSSVLADRPRDRLDVKIVRPRGLPDVRVDAELLHHMLLALAYDALEAVRPSGKLRLSARKVGRSVAFTLEDDAEPIELEASRSGVPRGGRSLALRMASVLLARNGGRVLVVPRRGGNRIEVHLRGAAGRSVRQPG